MEVGYSNWVTPGQAGPAIRLRFRRDCAVLDRPIQETCGRVLDPKYVCQFYALNLLPFRVAKIGVTQVCFCQIRPFEVSSAKICFSEVSVLQSRVSQVRVLKIGTRKFADAKSTYCICAPVRFPPRTSAARKFARSRFAWPRSIPWRNAPLTSTPTNGTPST